MSEQNGNGNGDNGNRATVAMVLREVEGLAKLTAAHFETMNVRMDDLKGDLAGLAPRVEKVEHEQRAISLNFIALRNEFDLHVKDSDERIAANEVRETRRAELLAEETRDKAKALTERNTFWRRHTPTLILTGLATAPGWYAILFL